jgi:hypothetical protein
MCGQAGFLDIIHESTFYVFAKYEAFYGAATAAFDLSERINKLFFEDVSPALSGELRPNEVVVSFISREIFGHWNFRRFNILVQQYSGDPIAAVDDEESLEEVTVYMPYVLCGGSDFMRAFGWIPGGTAMSNFNAGTSLTFLTMAPDGKYTIIGKPEYISFLWKLGLPEEFHRQVKLVFTDSTDLTYDLSDFEAPANDAEFFWFGADYTALDIASNMPGGKTLWYYEVRLADGANDPLTAPRRYYIDNQPYQNVRTFQFLTSLGTWETVHFTGLAKNKIDLTQKISNWSVQPFSANSIGTRQVTDSFYQESQKIGMPIESKQWAIYMKDFLLSKFKYELVGSNWSPVENVTNNYTIDEEKIGYTFEYEYKYRFTETSLRQ